MEPELKFWSSRIGVAVVIAALARWTNLIDGLASADTRTAIGIVAQISATMLGFVLAALAILATITQTRLLRNMQRTGHFRVLLNRMFYCIAVLGIVTIIGLIFVFIPTIKPIYIYSFFVLVILAMLSIFDISKKFWMVLSFLHPHSTEP